MKIVSEKTKKVYQLTFTTGFSFRSSLTWLELKKLIKTYPITSYKEVKEVVANA